MKILVVDAELFSKLIHAVLAERQKLPIVVTGTIRGEEALTLIQQDQPDLVLINSHLADIPALELLKQIKALGLPIKLGILDKVTPNQFKTQANKLGIDVWLEVPFRFETLLAAIVPLLEK